MQQHLLYLSNAMRNDMESKRLGVHAGCPAPTAAVASPGAERTCDMQLVLRVLTKCFQQSENMYLHFTET